jgi:hypothetical protein
MRYRLKVIRVYAARHTAQVIKFLAGWNRAIFELVSQNVRRD